MGNLSNCVENAKNESKTFTTENYIDWFFPPKYRLKTFFSFTLFEWKHVVQNVDLGRLVYTNAVVLITTIGIDIPGIYLSSSTLVLLSKQRTMMDIYLEKWKTLSSYQQQKVVYKNSRNLITIKTMLNSYRYIDLYNVLNLKLTPLVLELERQLDKQKFHFKIE